MFYLLAPNGVISFVTMSGINLYPTPPHKIYPSLPHRNGGQMKVHPQDIHFNAKISEK